MRTAQCAVCLFVFLFVYFFVVFLCLLVWTSSAHHTVYNLSKISGAQCAMCSVAALVNLFRGTEAQRGQ